MLPEAEEWANGKGVDLRGPLAGIPVSLKDSIAVGGFDVSVGYSRNCEKPYQEDGTLVKILKAAGRSTPVPIDRCAETSPHWKAPYLM